jgi:predicted SprT family Zn-dependent metalloprotease
MKILLATADAFIKGQRVAVRLTKDEWYIGIVTKSLTNGKISINLNDGEKANISPKDYKIVEVNIVGKKGSYTDAEIKNLADKFTPRQIKPSSSRAVNQPNIPWSAVTGKVLSNDQDAIRLRYLEEYWNILNHTKFNDRMLLPHIRFLKNQQIKNFRGVGHWSPRENTIAINRRVFMSATPAVLYETLLHEMCHQAVTMIDHADDKQTDAHGQYWKAWMQKVGLNPNRYDSRDRTEYMTEDEKYLEEKKRRLKEEVQKDKTKTKLSWRDLGLGKPARYLKPETGKWVEGVLVCPNDQQGKRWIFVKGPYISDSWSIIPTEWLYKVDDPEKFKKEKGWDEAAIEIFKYLKNEKIMKQHVKNFRKLLPY